MSSPRSYFITFKNNTVNIHDAANGSIISTKMLPLPSGVYITNASGDTQAEYITVTCSNGLIQVYKKGGATSWSLYKTYYR